MFQSIVFGFGSALILFSICALLIFSGLILVRLLVHVLGLREKIDGMEINLQAAEFNKLDPNGNKRTLFSIFFLISFLASGVFFLIALSKQSSFNAQHELFKLLLLETCGLFLWNILTAYSWLKAAPAIKNQFKKEGYVSFFTKLSLAEGGIQFIKSSFLAYALLGLGYIAIIRDWAQENQQWSTVVIHFLLSIFR